MSRAIETPDPSDGAGPEAERQLVAAVERHREVLASVQEVGRPEAGQHVAVKAVGRDAAWSPAPGDLVDLHDRLDSEWRAC